VRGRCDHARARDRSNTKRTTDTKRSCVVTKKVSRKGLAVTTIPARTYLQHAEHGGVPGGREDTPRDQRLIPKDLAPPGEVGKPLVQHLFCHNSHVRRDAGASKGVA
jgi:hypothetical protein